MNYHPISQANKREQQNQQDSTSGWKSSLGKICKQNSARARTSILNSARVTGQRRRKLSTRDRGYTATTVTLQTKPTKRGNTDCRRFSKIRSIELATKPKRGKFTVQIIFFDATIGSKNYTICKIDTTSIFATDWGQPISLFTVLQ